jgi:hypothetical protein
MKSIIDLIGLIPDTSAIIRVKLVLVGIGAMIAGCAVMGIEGSAFRGGAIAVYGAVLIGIIALGPEVKPESAVPQGQPPVMEPVSSCEHRWFDQDEMLNYEPKLYRCLKCGGTMWG